MKSLCLLLLGFAARLPAAPQGGFADTVVLNARIWTGNSKQPQAEALAIVMDRIAAVGSLRDILPWKGPATRVVQAAGRRLLPGFIDSHVHFVSGGFQLLGIDLRAAASESEFARIIGERAQNRQQGEWITGGDWNHQQWPSKELPRRSLIDPLTPKTPVFVNRHDGHMALANSVALKLARIDRNTPDPPGGLIVKDPATGEPTGLLKDAAMDLVWRVIPDPTDEQTDAAVRAALKEAARWGVTSVHDMGNFSCFRAYQRLLKRNELSVRIYAAIPLPQWERLASAGIAQGLGSDWLRFGAVKGFMDGAYCLPLGGLKPSP